MSDQQKQADAFTQQMAATRYADSGDYTYPPLPAAAALPAAIQNDVWLYRIIVGALALVAVGALIGAIVLAALGVEPTTLIATLGSGAIAGMIGLLAPSPAR